MLARIRKSIDEKDQGFTLIELLVVMIIIGILAAIAIPVFLNQRRKATESSMKSDLRTVAQQMETYFTDNQQYIAPVQNVRTVTIGADTLTLSAGNTLTATGLSDSTTAAAFPAPSGFCLTIANTGAGQHWSYNSLSGGVASGDCPGAAAPAP